MAGRLSCGTHPDRPVGRFSEGAADSYERRRHIRTFGVGSGTGDKKGQKDALQRGTTTAQYREPLRGDLESEASGGLRMRTFARLIAGVACLMLLPVLASAQTSSIASTVRDASGAVLPGVTVEAASPALIEKVRSAVTNGEGRYNIVDLRPGTYTVTFALTGFSTVRREGIALSAGFTAT